MKTTAESEIRSSVGTLIPSDVGRGGPRGLCGREETLSGSFKLNSDKRLAVGPGS